MSETTAPARRGLFASERARTIAISVVVVAVVAWSGIGLDYSGLATFNPSLALEALRGLLSPDWGYVYDGSGEDLISLLLLTIGIAFLGTAIATVLAIPFALVSSRTLWHNPVVPRVGKFVCNVLRAFPELVYAIIFVRVVGPGPFAGALAIGVHQIGMLGKLFTEQIEAMDEAPVEAVRAVGGNFWQSLFYARLPQLMPIFSSLSLNHFEIAVRSASTLGLVGAGGIGAPLIFAIQARNWATVSIILIGVIFSMFISSVINLILSFLNDQVRSITFWTMGSLSGTGYAHTRILSLALLICGGVIFRYARELNAFAIGEDNARHIGVNVRRVKLVILITVSVMIGVCVSIGGSIGFVGLVVPHMARMIAGPNHRRLLPASMFSGAIFLLLADLIARTLLSPVELSIGVVTSLVGAAAFVVIFYRARKAG